MLMAVLECLKQARVTLNKDKCFSIDTITFLWIFSVMLFMQEQLHPDPKKVEAIQLIGNLKSPWCKEISRHGHPTRIIHNMLNKDL